MGSGKPRRFIRMHEWHRPAHYTGNALACMYCDAHTLPGMQWLVPDDTCKRRMVRNG